MATASSQNNTNEFGIIILGNAGSGKSYLCNILIGKEVFKHDFSPTAVTTVKEDHVISDGSNRMKIYNVPGLVDSQQKNIERNKCEIMKAFNESPISVVLFIWRQTGGRIVNEDIMGFKALEKAYKFPVGSLMFIVNDVPRRRPPKYNGEFFAELETQLAPMPVKMDDVSFIDSMEPEEVDKRNEARLRLFGLIARHHAMLQKKVDDIILDVDMFAKMREEIEDHRMKAQKNKEDYEKRIQGLTEKFDKSKAEADARIDQIRQQPNNDLQNLGPLALFGMALDKAGQNLGNFMHNPVGMLLTKPFMPIEMMAKKL
jgi:hypothetical protein